MMWDVMLLAARLLLAGVFAFSGFSKLLDRDGSRAGMVGFGIPNRLANPLAILLAVSEIALAVALLPATSAWWAAAGLLALLAIFSVAITVNLLRGRRPACHCFGQLSSGPVGWRTLVRNIVLAVLAAVVLWPGPRFVGPGVLDWTSDLARFEAIAIGMGAVELLLIVAMVWLLVQLWQLIGRLLLRIDALEERLVPDGVIAPTLGTPAEGLTVGSSAPGFKLDGLHGETLTLEALRSAGKPVMLLFADPGCGPCTALMPEVGRWQREYASVVSVVLVSRGTPEDNRAKAAEHGLSTVLLQMDHEVASAYQTVGTPSAVLVRADGTIGSTVASGAEAIRSLLTNVTAGDRLLLPVVQAPLNGDGHRHDHHKGHDHAPGETASSKVGEPAPPIELPDLNGKTVRLADFNGSPTLVLFWNPGCGFCQQMLADLKGWEAETIKGAPKLLVVSTGEQEANRTQGLKSPVLLDSSFSTGYAFGVNGTPSAVLVDPRGNIASHMAVGAQAVLALARPTQTTVR